MFNVVGVIYPIQCILLMCHTCMLFSPHLDACCWHGCPLRYTEGTRSSQWDEACTQATTTTERGYLECLSQT